MEAAALTTFAGRAEVALDIVDVNIAAGELRQELERERRRKKGWRAAAVVLAVVLSDLLPIGPVDLGLIPDAHPFAWTVHRSVLSAAGQALYHVDPDHPHFLGIKLAH